MIKLRVIIRLPVVPVGEAHQRHLTARIIERLSPDECRLTTWDYTLSSRPKTDSERLSHCAWMQSCICIIKHNSVLLPIVEDDNR